MPKNDNTTLPSFDKELLDSLEVVTETNDYLLVVFPQEYRELYDSNYGIVNKQYCVVEAMYGALFAGFQIIKELQAKLEEERPRAKLYPVQ